MADATYRSRLDDYFVFARRTLPTGEQAEVIPLTFGRARLVILDGPWSYRDGW